MAKVTGTWDFTAWFGAWFVPFINRNSAITVLPNYRFIPEHNGNDILEDLADFWTWFNGGGVAECLALQNVEVELDYDHLLVSGESAGGYMALHSAIPAPRSDIKAILGQYPMTNYLRRDPSDIFMDQPAPPASIIDEHIASMKPGTVISATTPPARADLSYALSAYRRYNEFFGTGKHLWPISAVEDVKSFPPTLIIHGEQDTAVSIEDSRAFVKKLSETVADAEIRLAVRDGDHGFDVGLKEDEEAWLSEGLQWLESKWLA